MKNILLLFPALGMMILKSGKSEPKKVTKSEKVFGNETPSDQIIQSSINQQNIDYSEMQVIGKCKVSEGHYSVYCSTNGDISKRTFELLHLDNGIWLLNNPGFTTWML